MKPTKPYSFGCLRVFLVNFTGQNNVKFCQIFMLSNFIYLNLFLAYFCNFLSHYEQFSYFVSEFYNRHSKTYGAPNH